MSVLYNQDKQYPGRYLLLDIIKDQIARCNCELFLRWLEQEKGKPRFTFLSDVRTILDNNKENIPDTTNIPISTNNILHYLLFLNRDFGLLNKN